MPRLRVEFHAHTIASKDSLTTPAQLIAAARRKRLDRVIVTDHNSTAGAREAHRLDSELIIVGEEIMTTRGEILAAFVREQIPAGLPPYAVIRELRSQGAFISVSHPFDARREGAWEEADLLEILPLVDAIEVFNSRSMSRKANERALAFARRHRVAGTVGSDAHASFELGRSVLRLEPFEDAEGLRRAVEMAEAETRASPLWFHLVSRYAAYRKRKQPGT